jgi:putative holliday junction resolvase
VTRLLGIDLGERRVGVALAEADGSAARPLTTLRRGRTLEADIAGLARIVAEQRVDELVVGLPLDMSGGEGEQARSTRGWATSVAEALALPLVLRDERLSSHVAEQRLGPMPRGRSGGAPTKDQRDRYRSRVDREAAAIILQDELDARAGLRAATPRAGGPSEDQR